MKLFAYRISPYFKTYTIWDCTEEKKKIQKEIEEMERAFKIKMYASEETEYILKRLGATGIIPAETKEEVEEHILKYEIS